MVPQMTGRWLFVESVDANSVDGDTPLEHLRASQAIATERGFASLAVARAADGEILTPPGFTDGAFDVAADGAITAAARTIEAGQWGLPLGADYVAQHWASAAQTEPALERLEDVRWPLLYVNGTPRAVIGSVIDVRLLPVGGGVVWSEWVRGPDGVETHVIWTEGLDGGRRRFVTSLATPTASISDMSVSPDGRWLLVGHPVELVDLLTGASTVLSSIWSASWYPSSGPSSIIGVTASGVNEPCDLVVVDLARWSGDVVGRLPRRTNGLTAAPDGAIAARVNAESEALGGGWFDELLVADGIGEPFEPILPLRSASGWRRRCSCARWDGAPALPRPLELADTLQDALATAPAPATFRSLGAERFAVEMVRPRVEHRLACLQDSPEMAGPVLAELGAMLELTIEFDPQLRHDVINDVGPIFAAVGARDGWSAELRERADSIIEHALRRRDALPLLVDQGPLDSKPATDSIR